ncbi:hypothetical protein [Nocardia sp. NPDC003963]
MRRLSVVDEIFLRTHQGLGTPIALQGLWRTGAAVDTAVLTGLSEALRTGPLARRVVRPRIPGARSRWQHNEHAYPLDLYSSALAPAEIASWADTRGNHLDPEHGPGWRLSAAPLTGGGTVVALTCSHVLTDARGLIIAVELALRELDPGAKADTVRTGDGPIAGPAGARDSDWADAARIWATVAVGGMHAAAARIPRRVRQPLSAKAAGTGSSAVRATGGDARAQPTPSTSGRPVTEPDPRLPPTEPPTTAGPAALPRIAPPAARTGNTEPPRSGNGRISEPAVILRCPAPDWERIAGGYGGTANSLFIWFVANTLWGAGFAGAEIAASLPVDTRHEPRIDNDLAMTEITVTPPDGPAEIRAKSRAAYERRISSPGGLPEEFLHLVPDRVAHRLSRGAGERDVLCSNIGRIPPALSVLGPHECTGIATRAIHPGLVRADRPRTRLSGYLCRFRDDYILTLASLYPERIPDAAALHVLATATATRVELPIRPW